MSITSTSTLTEIYDANTYVLTESDKQQMQNVTATTGQIIGIGLAGFDLSGVYEDCAVATDNCAASAYNAYDGYAVVAKIWDQTSDTTNLFGACMDDDICFTVDPTGTDYAFETLALTSIASATNPDSMTTLIDSACSTNTGGFNSACFAANTGTAVSSKEALLWRFEPLEDRVFEKGVVTQIVAIDTTSVAAGTNVVSSITLLGAVSLAATLICTSLSAILF